MQWQSRRQVRPRVVAPKRPLPLGFFKRLEETKHEDQIAVEKEGELRESISSAFGRGTIDNVSGGFRTDPFVALPLKASHTISLAMHYPKSVYLELMRTLADEYPSTADSHS